MLLSTVRALALGSLLSTSFARVNNVPIDNSTIDELYAAALKEDGKLVVASGGDAGVQGAAIRTAWAARFPKIALDFQVDLSKYHDSRIDRGYWSNNHTYDIAMLQTLQDFQRWKEEGRLLFYKPPTFLDLYAGETDLDGAFVPTTIGSFGSFIYDSDAVSPSDVPTSYADLLDPKWKGKIPKMSNGSVELPLPVSSFVIIITTSHPLPVHHHTDEFLGFTGYPPANASYIKTAEPPAPEQHMAWAQTAAAFTTTQRPNTAKLFLAWITSDEYQKPSTLGSVRKSLDVNGATYKSNTTQTSQFRQFMQDRKRVDWWKLQYETTLGSAQGVSPLELYP
ncbi:hypothetical protein DID88_009374 [Monilinia fructigena]|uniref:Uncharacterized protein n=1 Tax=Monilinia fructigena TaxID=38457 RepID=A0A395IMD1_9HELO|nr:hypothetical protein DID88_009374 [Monilinia fructigena]